MKIRIVFASILLAVSSPVVAMAEDQQCAQGQNDLNCENSNRPVAHSSGGFFSWFRWGSSRSSSESEGRGYASESSVHSSEFSHGGFGGEAAGHGAAGE